MNSYQTYSKEELGAYKHDGRKRAECKRKLLLLMFNGFSNFRIEQNKYSCVYLIEEYCSLEDYTDLARADLDPEYLTLTGEAKKYFNVMVALDSLVLNGLVERRIWFSNDFSPEDGYSNLDGKLEGTAAQYTSWLARGFFVSNDKEKSFSYPDYMGTQDEYPTTFILEYIEYQLTIKGFDVALKFQEHNDHEKRFLQQTALTDKAVQASTSSAKTARIALWAAGAIALGSLGNLAFSLLKHFCVI